MELRHLITFKTIVERGGFKKAAEHLGYAQSSVTTHIQELEEEVGKPLFDRLGKKVIMTHYGERLLSYAIKIIDLHAQALSTDEEPTGDLIIGISESLTIDRVPPILLEYKKTYPKVNLTLKSVENNIVSSLLQNGDIDLVLVLEEEDWSLSEIHYEKLIREKMVLISPPVIEEDNRTVLYTERSCSYKSVFDAYLRYKKMDVKESLDFQSIEAIKQCVRSGLGISMVPYFSVKEEIESNKLRGEIVAPEHPAIATFLAYHKDKWLSPSMNSMISIIRNHAENWI
ncbi:LysR family transcriptional regulator [Oceanobacillus profundus]|uniref:LysR family transcriptional regulator n=1 Tax=Oceanobacillus profundus TaxID=372463 RepID=UPI000BA6CDEA|nr:LysR family transcriptional regulator [Oceanobacillus profundus]MCM3397167.1 LysR family transcriptional regulator [Oceanobacillus profundus]PAE28705.1 LysR family transcriptional regulator [Paenibacillus sp. 7884-2]